MRTPGSNLVSAVELVGYTPEVGVFVLILSWGLIIWTGRKEYELPPRPGWRGVRRINDATTTVLGIFTRRSPDGGRPIGFGVSPGLLIALVVHACIVMPVVCIEWLKMPTITRAEAYLTLFLFQLYIVSGALLTCHSIRCVHAAAHSLTVLYDDRCETSLSYRIRTISTAFAYLLGAAVVAFFVFLYCNALVWEFASCGSLRAALYCPVNAAVNVWAMLSGSLTLQNLPLLVNYGCAAMAPIWLWIVVAIAAVVHASVANALWLATFVAEEIGNNPRLSRAYTGLTMVLVAVLAPALYM